MVQPDPVEPDSISQLVSGLRSDVVSGASGVARAAAQLLVRAAREVPARSSSELVEALTSVAIQILDAQPAMAPLVSLAREVLRSLDPTAPLEEVRTRASDAATRFAESIGVRSVEAGRRAAGLLPGTPVVLTISMSSAVEAAVREAAARGRVEVVCLESRPMNEGRTLAARLAALGIPVTLAVDAAVESLIEGCNVVLVGTDSIGDAVVNKIGSASLAHAAARVGVPVHVVADSSKLLPPGFPQHVQEDRPAREVWEDAGAVRVWNRYFEVVPSALITAVTLEDGSVAPEHLDRRRAGLVVPPALAAWAASRARGR